MKKLILIFFVLLTVGQVCEAQQLPLFSVYRDQWSVLNPAAISNNYILNKRSMSLVGSWRTQWWNVAESPSTQTLNWEWVADQQNSVFGAHVVNDRAGKLGQTGLYGRYAYRIQIGRRNVHTVAIGLQAGVVQYRAKLSEIKFPDPNTPPLANEALLRPDIGIGAFYHYGNKYYAGISIPQTFGLNTSFRTEDVALNIRQIQHFYAVLGGYIGASWLGNETSFIEPSMWIKYVPNSPLNVDLNARVQISELFWAGTGVNMGFGQQPNMALHVEAGVFFGEQVRLEDYLIKAGFGFDLPLLYGLANHFGSAVEINVVYAWR